MDHELLFRSKRILLIYDRNELGDYLHKVLPLLFLIKCKNPKASIDILNLKEPKPCVTLISEKMNLTRSIDRLDGPYDFIYVYDCSKYLFPVTPLKQMLRHWLNIHVPEALLHIERTPGRGLYITQKKIFFLNYLQDSLLDYIPYYNQYYRQAFLAYFRKIFYDGQSPRVNDITINIGSFNKNKGANNNRLFQDRIAEVIRSNPEKGFNLIGYSDELVSPSLKALLNEPRVCNFLDKIDKTHGMLTLINLLFQSKYVIVRNTGILHLAGLCNSHIITLSASNDIRRSLYLRRDIRIVNRFTPESAHVLYHEKWMPFADNIISIHEYKKGNPFYNRTIGSKISQVLNGQLPEDGRGLGLLGLCLLGLCLVYWGTRS